MTGSRDNLIVEREKKNRLYLYALQEIYKTEKEFRDNMRILCQACEENKEELSPRKQKLLEKYLAPYKELGDNKEAEASLNKLKKHLETYSFDPDTIEAKFNIDSLSFMNNEEDLRAIEQASIAVDDFSNFIKTLEKDTKVSKLITESLFKIDGPIQADIKKKNDADSKISNLVTSVAKKIENEIDNAKKKGERYIVYTTDQEDEKDPQVNTDGQTLLNDYINSGKMERRELGGKTVLKSSQLAEIRKILIDSGHGNQPEQKKDLGGEILAGARSLFDFSMMPTQRAMRWKLLLDTVISHSDPQKTTVNNVIAFNEKVFNNSRIIDVERERAELSKEIYKIKNTLNGILKKNLGPVASADLIIDHLLELDKDIKEPGPDKRQSNIFLYKAYLFAIKDFEIRNQFDPVMHKKIMDIQEELNKAGEGNRLKETFPALAQLTDQKKKEIEEKEIEESVIRHLTKQGILSSESFNPPAPSYVPPSYVPKGPKKSKTAKLRFLGKSDTKKKGKQKETKHQPSIRPKT